MEPQEEVSLGEEEVREEVESEVQGVLESVFPVFGGRDRHREGAGSEPRPTGPPFPVDLQTLVTSAPPGQSPHLTENPHEWQHGTEATPKSGEPVLSHGKPGNPKHYHPMPETKEEFEATSTKNQTHYHPVPEMDQESSEAPAKDHDHHQTTPETPLESSEPVIKNHGHYQPMPETNPDLDSGEPLGQDREQHHPTPSTTPGNPETSAWTPESERSGGSKHYQPMPETNPETVEPSGPHFEVSGGAGAEQEGSASGDVGLTTPDPTGCGCGTPSGGLAGEPEQSSVSTAAPGESRDPNTPQTPSTLPPNVETLSVDSAMEGSGEFGPAPEEPWEAVVAHRDELGVSATTESGRHVTPGPLSAVSHGTVDQVHISAQTEPTSTGRV